MPVKRYIAIVGGVPSEALPVDVSAGAGDAGKMVALDGSGRLDTTMLPVGIGAETKTVLASEALSAGNFVQVYNNAAVANVRRSDGSTSGKHATGFVLAAVASGAMATVYLDGINNMVTGQTVGLVYLGTTAGAAAAAGATVAGQTYQQIGEAVSATEISFTPQQPILRA